MSENQTLSSKLDSSEEIQSLWVAYRDERTEEQREALILHYAPLVSRVVGRMGLNPDGAVEWEDLVNYGVMGLIDAIERYDPGRGVLFATFASLRIRGAVLDALRQLDPLGRLARRRVREARTAIQEMTLRLGRAPDDHEVAEEIGVTDEQYQQVLQDASFMMLSLDQPVGQGGDSQRLRLGDMLEDPSAIDTLEQIEEQELHERLIKAIRSLPRREQVLLSLYYYEDLTMREVASVMDISQTRVCQLHARAVLNLKAQLAPALPSRNEPEENFGQDITTANADPRLDDTSRQQSRTGGLDRRKASYRAQKQWSKMFDADG